MVRARTPITGMRSYSGQRIAETRLSQKSHVFFFLFFTEFPKHNYYDSSWMELQRRLDLNFSELFFGNDKSLTRLVLYFFLEKKR